MYALCDCKTIKVQVALLGGRTFSLEIYDDLCATVFRLNALIDEQWGYPPRVQTLILGAEILDQFALLKDVGVYDGCLLTLIVSEDEGTATSHFEPLEGDETALAVGDRVDEVGGCKEFSK